MDEETLDQKHYLGNELFAILQQVKTKIQMGEMLPLGEEPDKEKKEEMEETNPTQLQSDDRNSNRGLKRNVQPTSTQSK